MDGATRAFFKTLRSDIGGENDGGLGIGETAPSDFDSGLFVVVGVFVGGGKSIKGVVDVEDSGGDSVVKAVAGNFFGLGDNTWRNAADSADVVVIEVSNNFDLFGSEMLGGGSGAIIRD